MLVTAVAGMATSPGDDHRLRPVDPLRIQQGQPRAPHLLGQLVVRQAVLQNVVEATNEGTVEELGVVRGGDDQALGLVLLEELQE